ncbi:MAG TPA: DegT/DnrJ/EryC1/StrS family aminotransferase [Candidatus Hydrogenedentes bacterium]|nr:DegT/DnrJ/EryC1/StrS family aminotransferase [Candidatus Hydrogenedentota bacterium]
MNLPDARIGRLVAAHTFPEPIYVTRPSLPPLAEYARALEPAWERRWLTNEGCLHQRLERALCAYLGVEHLSLFCNATIALMAALELYGLHEGEVVTTPFTFPATTHVLRWQRLDIVFADIDADTCNLDPSRVEERITPRTRAIMPVHVYGTPCDVERFDALAAKYHVRVIYDAAHAFGVRLNGQSALRHGDASVLSFHATKLFTTGEGGALAVPDAERHRQAYLIKNFGIAGEESVEGPGINGKMSELQAALGLVQLEQADEEIARRRVLSQCYRRMLADIPGVCLFGERPGVQPNHAYFPVRINAEAYGAGRDALHDVFRRCNVHVRKYFYPLCSHFACYAGLPSADPAGLPNAERAAREILCLPIHGTLSVESVETIASVVREFHEALRK